MAGPVTIRRLKITAPVIVVDSQTILRNASILVHNGAVISVDSQEALRNAKADRTVNLPGHILHPGFVNAHCHLELSYMKGRLVPRAPFTRWIEQLIALRSKTTPPQIRSSIRQGVRRLAQTGATCVGDVSQTGLSAPALAKSGLRGVVFHETIGLNPALALERFADMKRRIKAGKSCGGLLRHGAAPHAVYSTSPALIRMAAEYASAMGAPISLHMAETLEEDQFSKKGSGPFKALLETLGPYSPDWAPHDTPVRTAEKTGALSDSLLVHFNHPSRGDAALLQKHGARVAYCPNSNLWFGRNLRHPAGKLIERGVPVGLGTDSLASNWDLDMRSEMRTFIKSFPALGFQTAFHLATAGGAAALGLGELFGTLKPGAPFDAAALKAEISPKSDPLRSIISARNNYSRIWVNGTPVSLR